MVVADKKTVKEYDNEIKKLSAGVDQLRTKTQNESISYLADENKVIKLRQTLEEIKVLPLQFSDLELSRKKELQALQKQVDEKKLCVASLCTPLVKPTPDSDNRLIKRDDVSRFNSTKDVDLVMLSKASPPPPPPYDKSSTPTALALKITPPVLSQQKHDEYGSDSDQSDAFFGNKPLVPKLTSTALKPSIHVSSATLAVIKPSPHKVLGGGNSAVTMSESRRAIREVSLSDKAIAKTLLKEKDNKLQQPGLKGKIDKNRRDSDGWYDSNEYSFDKL